MQTTAASTIAQQNAQLNSQTTQYQINASEMDRQIKDNVVSSIQDAIKIGNSALSVDKENFMNSLAAAYEAEKAKGTFDYVDMNEENGEEFNYENVQKNVRAWKDNWIKENGGLIGRLMGKEVDTYLNSLDADIIEDTKLRSYNYVQNSTSQNIDSVTSVFYDPVGYDITPSITTTYSTEGYTTIEQLVGITEYGIGEVAQEILDARANNDLVTEEHAMIKLRLALAAKRTGQSEYSYDISIGSSMDNILRSFDLAQYVRGEVNEQSTGLAAKWRASADDSVFDTAMEEFRETITNSGITLSDGTVILPEDLSTDDVNFLVSCFSDYGKLVVSSTRQEQEQAWKTSETAYNQAIQSGKIFMSAEDELAFRKKNSGLADSQCSDIYFRSQIPATREAEYASRGQVLKLCDAYDILTSETATPEERADSAQWIKDNNLELYSKVYLGLGSDMESSEDDTPIGDNKYMRALQNWVGQKEGRTLAEAIVHSGGIFATDSADSAMLSTTGFESDIVTTYTKDEQLYVKNNAEKFWKATQKAIKEGKDVKTYLAEKGFEVEDKTSPAYSLYEAYESYTATYGKLDIDSANGKELFEALARVNVDLAEDGDAERIESTIPTFYYNSDPSSFQIGYMSNNLTDYDSTVVSSYAQVVLDAEITGYIEKKDWESFSSLLTSLGQTGLITEEEFKSLTSDSVSVVVSQLVDPYIDYSVDAYYNLIAAYPDAQYMRASGSTGDLTDQIKQDVKNTYTSLGDSFLRAMKYRNPSFDISKGWNGIMPSTQLLSEMGVNSPKYKTYAAAIFSCTNESDRQRLISEARMVLTDDAVASLQNTSSINLLFASSEDEAIQRYTLEGILKNTLTDTSKASELMASAGFTELQNWMASDSMFLSQLTAAMNDKTNPAQAVFDLVSDKCREFIAKSSNGANARDAITVTEATGFDMVAELDDADSSKDYVKFMDNTLSFTDTYVATVDTGTYDVVSACSKIFDTNSNVKNSTISNMYNLEMKIGTDEGAEYGSYGEETLLFAMALNAVDPDAPYEVTDSMLTGKKIKTTKEALAVWLKSLDENKQYAVRAVYTSLYGAFKSLKGYKALGFSDNVKIVNGNTIVSDVFGTISIGEDGSYYAEKNGKKISHLEMYSDTTSTYNVAKYVLGDDADSNLWHTKTSIKKANYTSDTIQKITDYNTTKGQVNKGISDTYSDTYALIAFPQTVNIGTNRIFENSIMEAVTNGEVSYTVGEYSVKDVKRLYDYYVDNNDTYEADLLLQQLSTKQKQYVTGDYSAVNDLKTPRSRAKVADTTKERVDYSAELTEWNSREANSDGLSVRNIMPLLESHKDDIVNFTKTLKEEISNGKINVKNSFKTFGIQNYGSLDKYIDYLVENIRKKYPTGANAVNKSDGS